MEPLLHLHTAVLERDTRGLQRLLKRGANVNERDQYGQIALHISCWWGRNRCVKILIDHGAQLNILSEAKLTPLHIAARHGYVKILTMLLKADVSDINGIDPNGDTALHMAAAEGHLNCVEILNKYLVHLSLQNNDGSTPLHLAAEKGHANIVFLVSKFLAKNKAIDTRDNHGLTPLLVSCKEGNLNCAYVLTENGARVNCENYEKWTPLHFAVINGDDKFLELLIKRGADVNAPLRNYITALYLSYEFSQDVCKDILIKNGGKINIDLIHNRDPPLDETLGHLRRKPEPNVYIRNNICEVRVESHRGSTRSTHGIIKNRTNLNFINKLNGWTLLHRVVESGDTNLLVHLIQSGANVNLTPQYHKFSTLHLACVKGHLDCVKILLQNGAKVNSRAINNWTPLLVAISTGREKVVKFLMQNGADINVRLNDKRSVVHLLSEIGITGYNENLLKDADINCKDCNKWTPLHYAAFYKRKESLKFLIQQQADINACDSIGWTALHYSCYLNDFDGAKLLILKGADIKLPDIDGKSPLDVTRQSMEVLQLKLDCLKEVEKQQLLNETLHETIVKGQHLFLKDLIKKEADIRCYNNDRIPLHLSLEEHQVRCSRILLKAGAEIDLEDREENFPLFLVKPAFKAEFIKLAATYLDTQIDAYINEKYIILKEFKERIKPLLNVEELIFCREDFRLLQNEITHRQYDFFQQADYRRRRLNMIKSFEKFTKMKEDCNTLMKTMNIEVLEAMERDKRYAGKYLRPLDQIKEASRLQRACAAGNIEMVKYLKGKHNDIKCKTTWLNMTLLHCAAMNGHYDVIKYLLKHKLDITILDDLKRSPLDVAVLMGHVQCAELLSKLRKGKLSVEHEDLEGLKPLHVAAAMCNEAMVTCLVEKNRANVNSYGKNNERPIHLSAGSRNVNIFRNLIKYGAETDCDGYNDMKLQHYAAAYGGYEILKILLEEKNADVNSLDKNKRTPLHHASMNGHIECVKILLQYGARLDSLDINRRTAAHLASLKGHTIVLKNLEGALLDISDENYRTALHMASERGDISCVDVLLKMGANVLCKDSKLTTPLHLAAENGHEEVLNCLSQIPHIINERDHDGRTPLHLATRRGHFNCVTTLYEAGGDVNCKDKDDTTAVHLAADYGHETVLKFLVAKAEDLETPNKDGRTALHLASKKNYVDCVFILIQKEVEFECKDIEGKTPLHWACENGHTEVVKLMMKYKPCVKVLDNNKLTPLHLASKEGYCKCAKILFENKTCCYHHRNEVSITELSDTTPLHLAARYGRPVMLEYLIKKGADVNATNSNGQTALHMSAKRDCLDSAKKLIERGVNIECVDSEKKTALHIAAEYGSKKVLEYMLTEANLEPLDAFDRTPSILAFLNRHDDCKSILLKQLENNATLK